MINLITNEDYFAIYSFTDSVSSLIGVKEHLKNQLPKEGVIQQWIFAIQRSLKALASCLNSIKQNAEDNSSDIVSCIDKMNSLIKSTNCDLMSELVSKTFSLNFNAYNQKMYAKYKNLQALVNEVQAVVTREKSLEKIPLADAYIDALDLFRSAIVD